MWQGLRPEGNLLCPLHGAYALGHRVRHMQHRLPKSGWLWGTCQIARTGRGKLAFDSIYQICNENPYVCVFAIITYLIGTFLYRASWEFISVLSARLRTKSRCFAPMKLQSISLSTQKASSTTPTFISASIAAATSVLLSLMPRIFWGQYFKLHILACNSRRNRLLFYSQKQPKYCITMNFMIFIIKMCTLYIIR